MHTSQKTMLSGFLNLEWYSSFNMDAWCTVLDEFMDCITKPIYGSLKWHKYMQYFIEQINVLWNTKRELNMIKTMINSQYLLCISKSILDEKPIFVILGMDAFRIGTKTEYAMIGPMLPNLSEHDRVLFNLSQLLAINNRNDFYLCCASPCFSNSWQILPWLFVLWSVLLMSLLSF